MAHTRIRDMAAYHIQKIRSVQPRGPYLLGGMCAGGVIAFEMALQLEAQGERAALVALLDAADQAATLNPRRSATVRLERKAGELRLAQRQSAISRTMTLVASVARKLRNFTAYQVGKAWRESRDNARLRLLRAALDRGRSPPKVIGQLSATVTYLYAEREYRPGRGLANGDLVLFKATSGEGIDAPFSDFYEDPLFGWNARSARGVRALAVPGGHTSMLQEPHVDVLAASLQAAVDASLAESGRESRSGAARAVG
jgi:thioesterase domain-containing protein